MDALEPDQAAPDGRPVGPNLGITHSNSDFQIDHTVEQKVGAAVIRILSHRGNRPPL
jgi:hypothetical protein